MKWTRLLIAALMVSSSIPMQACAWLRQDRPRVQMAILLDTSNSMDGLIEQAKNQLWRIVNDLAYAKRRGQNPVLEVGVYEYGNDNLSRGENYVRQVLPFTDNLDQVSQALFALRTRGGSEYCGAVIQDAVTGLRWNRDDDTYKVVFIAGNEPFTQGPVHFREAITQAQKRGIYVNTIFCGNREEGVRTDWQSGALVGGGRFLTIDQDRAVVIDPTPYDGDIDRLGRQLNDTYIGYGHQGRKAVALMSSADSIAASAPAASGARLERQLYKASAQNQGQEWDIVSRAKDKKALGELKAEDLPAELRGKSTDELSVELGKKQAERESLQKELASLKMKRDAHLAEQARTRTSRGEASLDEAMRDAIRAQAVKKGFEFVR